MRLLLDQGLPRGSVAELRTLGHDAVHASDVGLARASDEQVLDRARAEDRTVLTLDADFHAILARTQAAGPSVIRIRCEGLDATRLVLLIRSALDQLADEMAKGAIATVDERRIRWRHLPIS
ncbi:MAG: DUF5615 family PIN-like protein [Polyangiaceae bacterium]